MDTGQWLTRGTVWLALSLYVAAEIARRGGRFSTARWLNSLGGVALLAHVASAFHYHHDWSHTAAYAETARQTNELLGWNWGGGLFTNYAFTLVWVGEVMWSWAHPASYGSRKTWQTWTVRGFFWFMIFNGAVVFVGGRARWLGTLLCLLLAWCWWPRQKPSTDLHGPHSPG